MKFKNIVFILVALIGFMNKAFSAEFNHDRFQFLYDKAQMAFDKSEYQDAENLLVEFVNRNSIRSCNAYKLLAQVKRELSDTHAEKVYNSIYNSCLSLLEADVEKAEKQLDVSDISEYPLLYTYYLGLLRVQQDDDVYEKYLFDKELSLKSFNNLDYKIRLISYYYLSGQKKKFNSLYQTIENEDYYSKPIIELYNIKINEKIGISTLETLLKRYENIEIFKEGELVYNFYAQLYGYLSQEYKEKGDYNNYIYYYTLQLQEEGLGANIYGGFFKELRSVENIEMYKEGIIKAVNKEYYEYILDFRKYRAYLGNTSSINENSFSDFNDTFFAVLNYYNKYRDDIEFAVNEGSYYNDYIAVYLELITQLIKQRATYLDIEKLAENIEWFHQEDFSEIQDIIEAHEEILKDENIQALSGFQDERSREGIVGEKKEMSKKYMILFLLFIAIGGAFTIVLRSK